MINFIYKHNSCTSKNERIPYITLSCTESVRLIFNFFKITIVSNKHIKGCDENSYVTKNAPYIGYFIKHNKPDNSGIDDCRIGKDRHFFWRSIFISDSNTKLSNCRKKSS